MKKSSLLSAATFGLLLASQSLSAEETKKTDTTMKPEAAMGECHGINSCKGQSLCGSKDGNECAGKNTCKGKGWISKTEKECKAKKGKWVAAKDGMHH
jgi:hypothetical protein